MRFVLALIDAGHELILDEIEIGPIRIGVSALIQRAELSEQLTLTVDPDLNRSFGDISKLAESGFIFHDLVVAPWILVVHLQEQLVHE